MTAKSAPLEPSAERFYAPQDRTSLTDDERIEDITPLPHNGCRPPKKRRV